MHHFPANATPNVTPISLPPPISQSHSGIFTPRPSNDHNADSINANAVNDHGRWQSPYFPAAYNTNIVSDYDNRQSPHFSGAQGINATWQSTYSSASIEPVPLFQSQHIQLSGSQLQPFGGIYAPQPSYALYQPFPSGSGVLDTRHQLTVPPPTIPTLVPLNPQLPPTPGGSPLPLSQRVSLPLAHRRVSLPSLPLLPPSNSQLEHANDDDLPDSNSNDSQVIESSSSVSSLGASATNICLPIQ